MLHTYMLYGHCVLFMYLSSTLRTLSKSSYLYSVPPSYHLSSVLKVKKNEFVWTFYEQIKNVVSQWY